MNIVDILSVIVKTGMCVYGDRQYRVFICQSNIYPGTGDYEDAFDIVSNRKYFYAFNTKGFKKEYPKKHKNRTKENICLRIQVTKQQYNKMGGIQGFHAFLLGDKAMAQNSSTKHLKFLKKINLNKCF